MSDKVLQHGMPPNRHTGHYNRKCKKLFEMEPASQTQYVLKMPGHDKNNLSKVKFDVSVVPPHEVLDRCIAEQPGILSELKSKYDRTLLPPPTITSILWLRSRRPQHCQFLFRSSSMPRPTVLPTPALECGWRNLSQAVGLCLHYSARGGYVNADVVGGALIGP